tara:strand:- start:1081 stop:1287 length:207 start_codon:yes stop_codon:yes gene_type:complete
MLELFDGESNKATDLFTGYSTVFAMGIFAAPYFGPWNPNRLTAFLIIFSRQTASEFQIVFCHWFAPVD